MLRQITLETDATNDFEEVARRTGVRLALTDCRSFNEKGMTLLFGIEGEQGPVEASIAGIRRLKGVRQVTAGERSGGTTPLLVVLDRPAICRASSDEAIICLECPFDSRNRPSTWRFLVRNTGDLRTIISRLGRSGVEARIVDASPLDQKGTLTGRQKEIVSMAVERGYFDFPRKVSLTQLSEVVGVKPSTLSEILRSAERRIMQSAVEAPHPKDFRDA